MENKREFSVIVCCYNPDFDKLIKTIASCVNQKDVSFEIIISDDCSKEKYEDKLRSWAKLNDIDLVYNFLEKNVGTIKNILSATKISKGEYIKTISPGDYFATDDALRKILEMYEKHNYDMVFAEGVFYLDDKIFDDKNMPLLRSTCGKKMFRNIASFADTFLGASLSFKREMSAYLHEIKDYMRLTEDLPLTYLTLLNNKKIGLIEENLFWYEYGTGVSSAPHGLDADLEGFLTYLKKNYPNNKYVKRSLKIWKINNIPNRFFRNIKLLFVCPDVFFLRLSRKLQPRKKIGFKISDQKKITELS